MCLIVLFLWVSFLYARILVWEICLGSKVSWLSLCYCCLHYCRKIFSGLRKRLFSFLKSAISLRCQAWYETCFFFHATAAQEKAICQARSSSLPPSIYVGEEVREKEKKKKQKTIFFIGHDSDFWASLLQWPRPRVLLQFKAAVADTWRFLAKTYRDQLFSNFVTKIERFRSDVDNRRIRL